MYVVCQYNGLALLMIMYHGILKLSLGLTEKSMEGIQIIPTMHLALAGTNTTLIISESLYHFHLRHKPVVFTN